MNPWSREEAAKGKNITSLKNQTATITKRNPARARLRDHQTTTDTDTANKAATAAYSCSRCQAVPQSCRCRPTSGAALQPRRRRCCRLRPCRRRIQKPGARQNSMRYIGRFSRALPCSGSTVQVHAWMASGLSPAHMPTRWSLLMGTGFPNSKMDVGRGTEGISGSPLALVPPAAWRSRCRCCSSSSCCCRAFGSGLASTLLLPNGHQPIARSYVFVRAAAAAAASGEWGPARSLWVLLAMCVHVRVV